MNSRQVFLSFLLALPHMIIGSDLEKKFTDIFKSNVLAYQKETISGMGSSLYHTETIRKELPLLFKNYAITSILDIGCGDFNWIKHIITDDITYIGVDIVKSIVDENNVQYKADNISFIHTDCCSNPLPKVDLVICRDVLAHLSYDDAFKLIENIKQSGSCYVLFTTYDKGERVNKDLSNDTVESNYCINMKKEPFFFIKPLCLINEKCPSPHHVVTPDKSLGLWHIDNLNKISSGVTYLDEKNWGGRLGDKLLMYVKARWVAYKYGINFFYKPFKYSDQMHMHEYDILWRDKYIHMYDVVNDPYEGIANQKRHTVELDTFIDTDSKLHIINYYFQPPSWGDQQVLYDSQDVGKWKGLYDDEAFRNLLRQRIKPHCAINEITLPKDRITVALHVRKGGGYDRDLLSLQLYGDKKAKSVCHCNARHLDFVDIGYMIKFPPDQFYVDQIRYLSKKYNDAPMYVHLFTDDLNPQALMEKYERAVGKSNITYGCREQRNHHDSNLLDDLFNMARFDCLIRSGSNFPQVAQLIGNFKTVLYPKHAEWASMLNVYDVGEITTTH